MLLKKIIKGLFVVFCLLAIFLFSSDTGSESTKKSDGVIIEFSSILGLDHLSQEEQQFIIDTFVVPVRKSAHFLIYFVLGILLISFFREFSLPIKKLILFSILFAFLYACSDEVHQLFVPGRSGRIFDVFIDSVGASCGVFLYYFLFRKKMRKEYGYEQEERVS